MSKSRRRNEDDEIEIQKKIKIDYQASETNMMENESLKQSNSVEIQAKDSKEVTDQELNCAGEQYFRQAELARKNSDNQEYMRLLLKSYELQFPDAVIKVAKNFLQYQANFKIEQKRITKTDLLKKLKALSKLQKKDAIYYRALIHEFYNETTQAFKTMEKAAKLGHASAQYKLARYYDYGNFTSQDRKKALQWYEKAAEQEVLEAIFKMGVMYHKGRGIDQDPTKALEFYKRAAEKGQSNANYNLGNALFKGQMDGKPITKNIQEGINYLQQAANQGHNKAQFQMGRLYAIGNKYGIEKSYEKAEKMMTQSYINKCSQALEPLTELKNINKQERFIKQIDLMRKIFHQELDQINYNNLQDIIMLVDHDTVNYNQKQVHQIIQYHQQQQQVLNQRNLQPNSNHHHHHHHHQQQHHINH